MVRPWLCVRLYSGSSVAVCEAVLWFVRGCVLGCTLVRLWLCVRL